MNFLLKIDIKYTDTSTPYTVDDVSVNTLAAYQPVKNCKTRGIRNYNEDYISPQKV